MGSGMTSAMLAIGTAALLCGCGSDDGPVEASSGAAGAGGSSSGSGGGGSALFPGAPRCESNPNLVLQGTLDGSPLLDEQAATGNLASSKVEAGLGLVLGGGFTWAFQAFVQQSWVKGQKQAFAAVNGNHSNYLVGGEHPHRGKYLCITGEIAPLDDPPEHVSFQWHITAASITPSEISSMSPPGADCSGPAVPADIYGCLYRREPYFP